MLRDTGSLLELGVWRETEYRMLCNIQGFVQFIYNLWYTYTLKNVLTVNMAQTLKVRLFKSGEEERELYS